jgi:phosphohistidine swiveling domain-containing protein
MSDYGSRLTVALDHPAAGDAALAGAKAANLARARRAGLPALPGVVLTTVGASALFPTGAPPAEVGAALRDAWRTLSEDGRRSLVVRSSSTVEDAGASSMAGRFTSLLDVQGWDEFLAAVRTVLDSATSPELSDAPMAVLVQPFLAAARGGVLFGADPVTGNADHLVAAAVEGGPDHLVSGTVDGATTTLTRRGRYLAGAPLDRGTRRRFAALAARTEAEFGGPQDMEWAVDDDNRLWLLQSRPITTAVHHPTGARLGPGPVAETFPVALAPLEVDLWVDPVRDGLTEALRLSGSVPARALDRSPVVATIDGQVAADLDLLEPARRHGLLGRLDPRPGARRLRAAWRVGRLRAALPELARDLIADIDADLLDVPPLAELSDRQLLGMLATTQAALGALHGHEVLAGLLLDRDGHASQVTGAAVALAALAEGRANGLDDATIIERDPVVLALVPPRVGPRPTLPTIPPTVRATVPVGPGEPELAAASREALRIRVRWVHELAAAAAWELGTRLTAAGRLPAPDLVRWLSLDELATVVAGSPAPADLPTRPRLEARPLPASFRLAADGGVVADSAAPGAALGAGGGRNTGPVHVGTTPGPGAVLVVRTLDPGLAPLLPGLGGLVAETGSPLSHLAILAREYGVPTVVGLTDAVATLRPGETVAVDGTTGTVRRLDTPATDTPPPDVPAPDARGDHRVPGAAGVPAPHCRPAGAGQARGPLSGTAPTGGNR